MPITNTERQCIDDAGNQRGRITLSRFTCSKVFESDMNQNVS